jgi:hypothetical protein
MQHWINGGQTNLDNLITLCGRHHNAVHELGWSMRGDANGEVTFVTPTGQTLVSVPSPTWRIQAKSSLGSGVQRRRRGSESVGESGSASAPNQRSGPRAGASDTVMRR